MSIELIRRFEPILYFHKDERFFPSDAKRYLEHCALWKASSPFEDKSSWEELIPRRMIAAVRDEVSQPGKEDDIYLGEREGSIYPYLVTNSQEERFLNPSGWIAQGGGEESEATPETSNPYAAVEQLSYFYGHQNSHQTVDALKESRFWYHAEAFDPRRLAQLGDQGFTTVNISALLEDNFREPFLLCYYLFFPGHVEGLQGCESVETGPNFGSFVGEWTCVAIILDEERPRYLGLASRNAAKNVRALDDENRIGMVIHDWDEVQVYASAPEHVKLYVAKDTHSLYLSPGQKDLHPLNPADPSILNCGATEKLAEKVVEGSTFGYGTFLAKVLLLGASGLIWSLLEDAPFGKFGEVIPPPAPAEQQKDYPPEEGDFGMIVHPPDFKPPDAVSSELVSWPADDIIQVGRRHYTIVVDRTSSDEISRPLWLPGVGNRQGYEGRWGPRVVPDPFGRRSGMRFPEFVELFLVALAKHMSA